MPGSGRRSRADREGGCRPGSTTAVHRGALEPVDEVGLLAQARGSARRPARHRGAVTRCWLRFLYRGLRRRAGATSGPRSRRSPARSGRATSRWTSARTRAASCRRSRCAAGPGKVVAFEPQPSLAEYLDRACRAARLTNVVVEAAGVSDVAGSRTPPRAGRERSVAGRVVRAGGRGPVAGRGRRRFRSSRWTTTSGARRGGSRR